MEQILLNGISFEQLENSLRTIVADEISKQTAKSEPTDNLPDLLTRKQTSAYLGISLPTLNEWTKSGVISAKRIGNRVRYEKQVVLNSLKDVETLKYRRA
ncbi:conserved hypothetical protein [uncultured Paludibacter sp.]|nr:conserved hypothetical protein [uncultured Paludibacter sp.]